MATLKYRDPADGVWKYVDGVGPAHPMCKIGNSATTAAVANNANTIQTFDTTIYDTGGMADLANNQIIIQLAGYYRFSWRVAFTLNTAGYRSVLIYKAGAIAVDNYAYPSQNTAHIMQGTSEAQWCNVGDTVVLRTIQTSGIALTNAYTNGRGSELTVEYAGIPGAGAVNGSNVTTLQATQDVIIAGASAPRGTGVVGSAMITANNAATSASTTQVDLTGLTCTVVSPGNRKYRINVFLNFTGTVADDRLAVVVKANGSQVQGSNFIHRVATTLGYGMMGLHAPAAGSYTYQVAFYRGSGTGTFSHIANSTAPSFLTIEDIGPIA